ncbi:putative lipoprotein [Pseudomonas sp. JUb42]|jgi:putative lipoprotein|uniref:YbaY family lipoprotein n=1 Tax=Pseudomonas sp. JUb42 TaxID=2940611 RepID=UPI0021672344|nr:YbaY family lipoprotein [Pseudomonas sp. JUb42]MCS3470517.1 putative lipoprotein [Pseudomonas sp. JUb42]
MTSERVTRLQGEVYYLPRIALPEGCTLTVTLNDITAYDAPAITIAVSQTDVTRQVPLPFELGYNARLLPQGRDYELEARIELQGRLLWINDTMQRVQPTDTDQTGLRIQVVQVNG